jgi:hypothetical protein
MGTNVSLAVEVITMYKYKVLVLCILSTLLADVTGLFLP